MTGATSGAGSPYPFGAPEFTNGFSGVRVTLSFVLYVCFLERSLSLWSLCCLSFDVLILITPLMSSSSFYGAIFRQSPWYVLQYLVCYLYLFHLHFPLIKVVALDQDH